MTLGMRWMLDLTSVVGCHRHDRVAPSAVDNNEAAGPPVDDVDDVDEVPAAAKADDDEEEEEEDEEDEEEEEVEEEEEKYVE